MYFISFFLSGVSRWTTSVICQTSQYELPQFLFWRLIVYFAIFCGMSRHVYCRLFLEHLTIHTEFSIFFFGHLTNTINILWVFNGEYSRRFLGQLKFHYLSILSNVCMNFSEISSFASRSIRYIFCRASQGAFSGYFFRRFFLNIFYISWHVSRLFISLYRRSFPCEYSRYSSWMYNNIP